MPCAHTFRSIQRFARFCTIQDDTDASVAEGSVHCPYLVAPRSSFADANDGSRVLGSARFPVFCRTQGNHSLPLKHSTASDRGMSELDSFLTPAGAPPSASCIPAQRSGSQFSLCPIISRHTSQLLLQCYTCGRSEAVIEFRASAL